MTKKKESFVDIIAQMPVICGVDDADRWDAIIRFVYNDELTNEKSAFHKNANDVKNPRNRLRVIFAWDCKDKTKKKYCEDLILLRMLNHYIESHKEKGLVAERDELKSSVDSMAGLYSDVDALMPESEKMSSFWDY